MAKQPTLTVNVQSQQFQRFAQQFNQFSNQVKQLNQQFAQINTSLQKQNVLVRAVNSSLTGMLNITKSIGSEVFKITKHFVSWSTIIGSITALLGMGGGLFGIERLAASILAKRRMVLGLGGDYGRTQASMIFSQGLIGSPQSVLQNIRLGMAGSSDQLTGLLAMGINPFGADARMDPDQVMDKIVDKLPAILNRAGPGKELAIAQAYHLDKLFTDPFDMLRLATKEGQEEYKMKKELTAQYKEQLKITPRALRAWTELELQFQAAKSSLQSAFGNTLADLAGPLKELSQGFANLVRTFMETPVVQQMIKKLGEGIKWLADKLKQLTEKDIEAFIEKVKSWLPTIEEFKTTFNDFVDILKSAVEILGPLFLKENPIGKAATATGASSVHDFATKYLPSDQAIIGGVKNFFGMGDKSTPAAPSAPTPSAPFSGGSWGSGGSPFNKYGGFGSILGGGPMLQTAPGATGFGWANSVTGGAANTWSGAARNMVPQQSSDSDRASFGERWGNWGIPKGRQPGPLSMDNWQMNRTANLTVRNVPGANIFMTATGMTG
jgi:hypothetical protein